jgi:O-acetyl-ADP-ribose deacetylase (regulator of RNase III)
MEVITERTVGGTRIAAVQGDITKLDVDAIVNAANEHLAHGGGVAAAIANAGAPDVEVESHAWVREHGPVPAGEAAVTSAGSMPADYVIHVVGPRYRDGQDNEGMLQAATAAALRAAAERDVGSVAFPAISAGIFGYPPDEATAVLTAAVLEWAASEPLPDRVLLVGYDRTMADRFAAALAAN